MSSSVPTCCYSGHGLHTIRSSSSSDRRSSHRLSSTVHLAAAAGKIGYRHFFGNPSLKSLNTDLQSLQNGSRNIKMDIMKVNDNLLPDVPQLPSTNPSDSDAWKRWLAGIFFTVFVPFLHNKWGPVKKLQESVEEVVDTAQEVTETVEDVAEGIGKVADELGDSLPQGGNLQKAALFVENLANQTVKHTDMLEEVLDKVEAVENKVEDFLEEQMDESKKAKKDETKKIKDEKITQTTKPGSL